jgi:hypothetical protein
VPEKSQLKLITIKELRFFIVRISERKLSASVSVSAEISAETDTEMSVSAVFRHFGIGRNVGLSKYRNLAVINNFLEKRLKKNKKHRPPKKNFPAFIKRKRLISSNLLTLGKKLITDTYQVSPINVGKKYLSSLLFKKNSFGFGIGIGFGIGMLNLSVSVSVAMLPIPKLPTFRYRQEFGFRSFTS